MTRACAQPTGAEKRMQKQKYKNSDSRSNRRVARALKDERRGDSRSNQQGQKHNRRTQCCQRRDSSSGANSAVVGSGVQGSFFL